MVRYYELFLSSHAYERRFLFRFDQRKNLHCLRSIVQTQLEQEIWGKSWILQYSGGIHLQVHFYRVGHKNQTLLLYMVSRATIWIFPSPFLELHQTWFWKRKYGEKVEFYSTVVVFTYRFTLTGWAIKIRLHYSSLTGYNLNFTDHFFGLASLDFILEQGIWGKINCRVQCIHLHVHFYRVGHKDPTT